MSDQNPVGTFHEPCLLCGAPTVRVVTQHGEALHTTRDYVPPLLSYSRYERWVSRLANRIADATIARLRGEA